MDEQEKLLLQLLEHRKALFGKALPARMSDSFAVREVFLEMRDGVRLFTKCYLPEGEGQFPTVLMRSCYPHSERALNLQGEEYSKRGFAFVYQWCRGTANSEGEWEPNVNERNDGLDTLEWLRNQPFSGNIGYLGDSYLALTGWCMADAVPEEVKSMYLGVYGTDRHVSAYKDGLFRQDILTAWAMDNAGKEITADMIESYKHMPQVEVDEKLWGIKLPWYRDWITSTQRSDSYWQQGFWKLLKDIPGKVKIPIYIREGWYDHHLGSALVTYQDLSSEAREHSTLQVGPWNHGYASVISHQNTDNLEDDSVQAPLSWFYKTLVENKLPQKEVLTYKIGADKWTKRDSFPPAPSGEKTLYLSIDGKSTGALKETADNSENDASYTYNPDNAPFAHGGESMLRSMEQVGSLSQPAAGYRDDVLSFISEPLEDGFSFCGAIKARLYVSSTAEDTAFYVKVMEEFEDGETVNIRGGITTLAFRNGSDARLTYTPDEIVEVNISMWDIDWKVQKNSKIRVDISSSHFPEYALHSNQAGIWSTQVKNITATQTLYAGGKYASQINFPLE